MTSGNCVIERKRVLLRPTSKSITTDGVPVVGTDSDARTRILATRTVDDEEGNDFSTTETENRFRGNSVIASVDTVTVSRDTVLWQRERGRRRPPRCVETINFPIIDYYLFNSKMNENGHF